jgi:ABC-2 type transport system permease protein
MMQTIIEIARHELITQWRSQTLKILLPLLLILTSLIAFAHWQQQQDFIEAQTIWQQQNDANWEAQPDRHPHRAAHYGTMVFRIISPLSFIDSGVNPFVGNALFLEAHRQNSSSFKQYVSSTGYMGLGYLSGATIILVIWPLVLIALAFNSVSGERVQGTLRQLVSQGTSVRQLLLGKTLAYSSISLVFLLVIFTIAIGFILFSQVHGSDVLRMGWMFILYLLYCLLWTVVVVLISNWCRTNQQSLSALLLFWLLTVIVMPKMAYSLADMQYPMPDRAVFDIQTAQEIAKVGDSHNPDDPHFTEFRERVLAEYGVSRVEDLPLNWRGIVMQEGERISSEVFGKQYEELMQIAEQQNKLVRQVAWFSTYLMANNLSSKFAGSNAESFLHYENAAEQYRFNFIKQLNQLHAEEIVLDHEREQKVSHEHWANLEQFDYHAPTLNDELDRIAPPLLMLLLWLVVGGVLLAISRNEVD